MSKLKAALWAGGIAVVLNRLVLLGADLIGLPTAKGGLIPFLETATGYPASKEAAFEPTFYVIVGIGMALVYAGFVEQHLPGKAWLKGLICAVVTWLLNAAYILPATGQGFAGLRSLTVPGVIWFAAAHTLFFVVMAVLYERLQKPTSADTASQA